VRLGPHARQITDEIYQVGGRGLTAAEDAAIFLVCLPGVAALIDSGCGRATDLLLANVEAAGVRREQIRWLLITHCHFDHTGGAHELRRRLGCRVVAHALDAEFIEQGDNEVTAASWYGSSLCACPVDRRLALPREDIKIDGRTITAVHIPGHSPGSVAYMMSSCNHRVVFAQDVHGPLHPCLHSNRTDYFASLQRLLELDADILCEGHYGIFEGREAIAGFIRQFMP
jgi:glyoxylase-like metal-dependent hydrolase (beta-lactamase superfamily II)